jgi:hypothetical protein
VNEEKTNIARSKTSSRRRQQQILERILKQTQFALRKSLGFHRYLGNSRFSTKIRHEKVSPTLLTRFFSSSFCWWCARVSRNINLNFPLHNFTFLLLSSLLADSNYFSLPSNCVHFFSSGLHKRDAERREIEEEMRKLCLNLCSRALSFGTLHWLGHDVGR